MSYEHMEITVSDVCDGRPVPAFIGRVWWLPRRFTAITLPPIGVFFKRRLFESDDTERVLRLCSHEAVHWEQYLRRRWGLRWLYYPVYLGLAIRYGYRNHPMEIEARRRAA